MAIPATPVLTPGESGRPGVEYATIKMNNINGAHVYGQFAKPAREGKFPALLILQWASPPYPLQKEWVTDRAAEGWLALNVEPHDVPQRHAAAFYDGAAADDQELQHHRAAQPRRELFPADVPRRLSRGGIPGQPARLGRQDDRRDGHEHGRTAEPRRRRPECEVSRRSSSTSRRGGRRRLTAWPRSRLSELERAAAPT